MMDEITSSAAEITTVVDLDLKKVLEDMARAIVDNPDSVSVTEEIKEDETVLTLHVAEDDMGMIIGKHGKIARLSGLLPKLRPKWLTKKLLWKSNKQNGTVALAVLFVLYIKNPVCTEIPQTYRIGLTLRDFAFSSAIFFHTSLQTGMQAMQTDSRAVSLPERQLDNVHTGTDGKVRSVRPEPVREFPIFCGTGRLQKLLQRRTQNDRTGKNIRKAAG